jgi:uncharacterized protein YkwD
MRPVALVLCTLSMLLVYASAAPAAQAAGPRLDRGERAVVHAVNGVRARHGLSRLRPAAGLARAADAHSRHMLAADYFAHGDFANRVRRYAPFRRVGETLAMLSRCNAGRTVGMWLRSPAHRNVIMSSTYRRVGVGNRTGRLGSSRACMVTANLGARR